jgi:hypothetical protein
MCVTQTHLGTRRRRRCRQGRVRRSSCMCTQYELDPAPKRALLYHASLSEWLSHRVPGNGAHPPPGSFWGGRFILSQGHIRVEHVQQPL